MAALQEKAMGLTASWVVRWIRGAQGPELMRSTSCLSRAAPANTTHRVFGVEDNANLFSDSSGGYTFKTEGVA